MPHLADSWIDSGVLPFVLEAGGSPVPTRHQKYNHAWLTVLFHVQLRVATNAVARASTFPERRPATRNAPHHWLCTLPLLWISANAGRAHAGASLRAYVRLERVFLRDVTLRQKCRGHPRRYHLERMALRSHN